MVAAAPSSPRSSSPCIYFFPNGEPSFDVVGGRQMENEVEESKKARTRTLIGCSQHP
ncbi:hypothetical protein L195_g020405 [Trifolium pratense]|uniref:Uncharacterized protein n=1 Tax=Trifolium pratense TaxID=57577 RepID=A0A2K3N294_TRIPR|nr:hypothetical protein L195_g020405 [Trifolium pratense]